MVEVPLADLLATVPNPPLRYQEKLDRLRALTKRRKDGPLSWWRRKITSTNLPGISAWPMAERAEVEGRFHTLWADDDWLLRCIAGCLGDIGSRASWTDMRLFIACSILTGSAALTDCLRGVTARAK